MDSLTKILRDSLKEIIGIITIITGILIIIFVMRIDYPFREIGWILTLVGYLILVLSSKPYLTEKQTSNTVV